MTARQFRADAIAEYPAELGESPLWDPAVGLRWLDVDGRQLLTLAAGGEVTTILLTERVSAVELATGRELLAVVADGFALLDPDTGSLRRVASSAIDGAAIMNDAGVDARGRCWAGSAVRDETFAGALYCLDGGAVSTHLDGLGMSNGIDFSPAADVLYHVDSAAGTLRAWDYDLRTGRLGESRIVKEVPGETGLPDGLTVDADGQIWLAVWGTGNVWRLDPHTGETTAVVEVPTPYVTSCAFGGTELSTLYITTADYQRPSGGGMLYAVDVPARGRLPHRVAPVTGV